MKIDYRKQFVYKCRLCGKQTASFVKERAKAEMCYKCRYRIAQVHPDQASLLEDL